MAPRSYSKSLSPFAGLFAFPLMIGMRSDLVSRKSCLNELLWGDFLIHLSASPDIFALREILDLVSSWLDSCKLLTRLLYRRPCNQTNGSCELKEICLLQMQRSEGERGFVNKVSWVVCWCKVTLKGKSRNEEVTEIRDNNEIMRLNWMKNELECRSERMCIHVGFYVIVRLIVQSEVVSFSTSDGFFPAYESLHTRGPLGQQLEWILAHVIWY